MALLAAGQVLASAFLDPLLERVISAAANELKLVRGVHKEVGKLTLTLGMVKRVLDDAEERQAKDPEIREWLRQLKDVFLDTDDLLDRYATDAAMNQVASMGAERRNKVRVMLFRCFTCMSRTITGRDIAHQICDINERLDYLIDIKKKFNLQELAEGNRNSHPQHTRRARLTSSVLADLTSAVGRDTEKNMIMDRLLSSTNYNGPKSSSDNRSFCFSVLPIVGMGGIGKTTLARSVFNDNRVKKHFQLMMWVCVSNDFDKIRLTKEMIDAACVSKGKNIEQYQFTHWDLMQRKLREEVEGSTFLLVLDDVWVGSRSQWEELFEPLQFANKGSKILVTSRSNNAVDISQGRMPPVRLQGLTEDELWRLFKRCAFGGNSEEEYVHLEEIGKQIAKRLKGLPLAAKTIGYLLNENLEYNHWREIEKSEIWELEQGREDGILPALGLSYQYLPAIEKQCFAYCSLFPEDHDFDKAEMAQLWGAVYFGGIRGCRRMEDTSSIYFDNLLNRSFFEPSPKWEGRYVMHDLTHDLAESVAKDDCFRLEDKTTEEIPDTVRHISLLVTKFEQARLDELCKLTKLRTLLVLRPRELDDLTHALDVLFSKMKFLRVLGLRNCLIKELPNSIGNLKHLRYIDLSENSNLQKLPESLGGLYNLQVLNLGGCESLHVLPTRMRELVNLRHLQANNELFFSIDGLTRLTGLEEVGLEGKKMRELEGMSMLRELRLCSLEEVGSQEEAIQAGLNSKAHLQKLMMGWGDSSWDLDSSQHSMRDATSSIDREAEEVVLQALRPVDSIRELTIGGYGGAKSPGWMVDPTTWARFHLERVELCFCPNWEVLPAFGRLRHLRQLEIRRMPSVKQLDLQFFPSLELLHIEGLTECEGWGMPERGFGHLTSLKILILDSCPKLSCPPFVWEEERVELCFCPNWEVLPAFGRLRHLRHLEIRRMPSVKQLDLQFFPSLELLRIEDLTEWEGWGMPERGFGHLTSLKDLILYSCPKLSCPPFVWEEEEEDAISMPLPSSLERLCIRDCGDATGGWWWAGLKYLTSLSQLSLGGCPTTVASLFLSMASHHHRHHLAETLTSLEIEGCPTTPPSSSSSPVPPPPLPSLPPNPEEQATAGSLRALASLQRLTISRCPNLLRMWGGGGLPSSLQKLDVNGDDGLDDRCLSRCLQYLTALRDLSISLCPAITSLPTGALEAHHGHHHQTATPQPQVSTTLQTPKIQGCDELASMGHFPALPSLKRLAITNCPKLNQLQVSSSSSSSTSSSPLKEFTIGDSSPQQMKGWLLQSTLIFPCLQQLRIEFCPQLTSFDEEGGGKELEEALPHLPPSLRSLTFWSCRNLRSLPATLSRLSSLQTLELVNSHEIRSLPETGLPASLRKLWISCCDILEERCRDQSSPDWPKISHIPEVYIGHRRVI